MPANAAPQQYGHQAQACLEARPKPRPRFLSNAKLINCFPDEIELDILPVSPSGKWGRIAYDVRVLKMLTRYDAFIAFNPDIDEAFVAFVAKWILRCKTSIIFYDMVLQRPVGLRGVCKSKIKQVLLTAVDRFLCVHKDTSGYQKYYGINAAKFVYIPFKANNFHDRLNYAPGDDGYALACGVSLRDYHTFIDAVSRLKVPAKIMLPARKIAVFHHTLLDEAGLPPNVTVIRDALDGRSWNQIIANARVVVIPIQRRAIQAAGISVCLEAMAIGKPVVITEGVSTRGMLTESEAEIVPAEDPAAMQQAIERIWNNPEYRDRLARRGQEYALSLGGVERLAKDILQSAWACVKERLHM